MAYGACDTSNACLEDAGADNKAALCDVVCANTRTEPKTRAGVLCGSEGRVVPTTPSTLFDQF